MVNIEKIESPAFLKKMDRKQLDETAALIREFLIQSLSKTGGHLSSNLGIVELTMALHVVFDSPKDQIIFDVGHQSYVHKILTGRAKDFSSLRQYGGLSGFQKRGESPHDPWEAGHSSTSLSAALGLAIARDLKKEDHQIVAVIGDGAFTGGMALEAINDIGSKKKKVIIIFNDNNMSISSNHSGMEQKITQMRTSNLYRALKKDIKRSVKGNMLNTLIHVRDSLKHGIIDAPLFEGFNVDYIGPVDGHDFNALIPVLQTAKEHEGPIVVHVNTQKGRGYSLAAQDKVGKWHGVPPFNIQSGRFYNKLPHDQLSWSEVISKTLMDLAKEDEAITAITPAMAQGSKLLEFASQYPDRFFDCGIAEQHAVTLASGMAQGGLKPFVSIYSSFLQRAYDQIIHDMARMDLSVVIGVDRAGLVGDDGETHQGIYDIAFLRTIPNLIIAQPKDAQEAQNLLYTAFLTRKPFIIRYPKGNVYYKKNESYKQIPIGTWTYEDLGDPQQIVISYGPDIDRIYDKAKENNLNIRLVNARYFKPIDEKMLLELLQMNLPVTVYETDVNHSGLSSAVLEFMNQNNMEKHINVLGLPDTFIPHGSIKMLRNKYHINLEALFEELEQNVKNKAG